MVGTYSIPTILAHFVIILHCLTKKMLYAASISKLICHHSERNVRTFARSRLSLAVFYFICHRLSLAVFYFVCQEHISITHQQIKKCFFKSIAIILTTAVSEKNNFVNHQLKLQQNRFTQVLIVPLN